MKPDFKSKTFWLGLVQALVAAAMAYVFSGTGEDALIVRGPAGQAALFGGVPVLCVVFAGFAAAGVAVVLIRYSTTSGIVPFWTLTPPAPPAAGPPLKIVGMLLVCSALWDAAGADEPPLPSHTFALFAPPANGIGAGETVPQAKTPLLLRVHFAPKGTQCPRCDQLKLAAADIEGVVWDFRPRKPAFEVDYYPTIEWQDAAGETWICRFKTSAALQEAINARR